MRSTSLLARHLGDPPDGFLGAAHLERGEPGRDDALGIAHREADPALAPVHGENPRHDDAVQRVAAGRAALDQMAHVPEPENS